MCVPHAKPWLFPRIFAQPPFPDFDVGGVGGASAHIVSNPVTSPVLARTSIVWHERENNWGTCCCCCCQKPLSSYCPVSINKATTLTSHRPSTQTPPPYKRLIFREFSTKKTKDPNPWDPPKVAVSSRGPWFWGGRHVVGSLRTRSWELVLASCAQLLAMISWRGERNDECGAWAKLQRLEDRVQTFRK